ncbi:uncharacterized protein LOC124663654 [Lolium rigidum]|uniref:uncharacterized protein LOC124663653 n=1 Tax=Lolium rigidum TaxID=89674 RepID=UPI001F5CE35A|nr:uncharacterized protein LOC124663653 [Lolium rigidum]XP_047057284.1 uncharacterized protein LOC124663654 [Lolium rigidum]
MCVFLCSNHVPARPPPATPASIKPRLTDYFFRRCPGRPRFSPRRPTSRSSPSSARAYSSTPARSPSIARQLHLLAIICVFFFVRVDLASAFSSSNRDRLRSCVYPPATSSPALASAKIVVRRQGSSSFLRSPSRGHSVRPRTRRAPAAVFDRVSLHCELTLGRSVPRRRQQHPRRKTSSTSMPASPPCQVHHKHATTTSSGCSSVCARTSSASAGRPACLRSPPSPILPDSLACLLRPPQAAPLLRLRSSDQDVPNCFFNLRRTCFQSTSSAQLICWAEKRSSNQRHATSPLVPRFSRRGLFPLRICFFPDRIAKWCGEIRQDLRISLGKL